MSRTPLNVMTNSTQTPQPPGFEKQCGEALTALQSYALSVRLPSSSEFSKALELCTSPLCARTSAEWKTACVALTRLAVYLSIVDAYACQEIRASGVSVEEQQPIWDLVNAQQRAAPSGVHSFPNNTFQNITEDWFARCLSSLNSITGTSLHEYVSRVLFLGVSVLQ